MFRFVSSFDFFFLYLYIIKNKKSFIMSDIKPITKEILEVSHLVNAIIDNTITNRMKDDSKYEKLYNAIILELEQEIEITEGLIKDFTEEKLSVNLIEQEGYLRCLRTMTNRFKYLSAE